MKRNFLGAILALATVALLTGTSQAGLFGCNPCGKCGADFCVRQYNAFSPVCHGTVFCDGIHPFAGPGFPGAVSPWQNSYPAGCPSCYGQPMMMDPMMGQAMMAPGMMAPGYPSLPMPGGAPGLLPQGAPFAPPVPGQVPPPGQPSYMPPASAGAPWGWPQGTLPVGYYPQPQPQAYPGYAPYPMQ